MRLAVLVALILSFSAFILGLLTLLAGSTLANGKGGFMEYASILRYDYSTFSEFGTVVTASTWASLHVLSLGDSKPLTKDGKGPLFAPTGMALVIGLGMQIGAAGLATLGLPWILEGKKHWNGFFVPILAIGWLGSIIAAVAGSAYSLGQTHIADPKQAPITYSRVWIGMLWAGLFCIFGAMALEHVERNLERFTPKELTISAEYRPKEVSWWVWNPWLRRSK